MNRIIFILALSGIVPLVAQAASPDLQITIATGIHELPTAGNLPIELPTASDLPISVTYRNLTNRQISLPIAVQGPRDVTDVIEVRDPGGRVIPPYYGPNPASSKVTWVAMSLNANEARSFGHVLYASEYGFVKPGNYTVQLKRESDGRQVPIVYSNTLTIRVVDWDIYAHQEKSKPELRIAISTDTSEITTGAALPIHATFANLTDHQIACDPSDIGSLDAINQFDLHGPDGNAIPPYRGPYPELGVQSLRMGGLSPKQSVGLTTQLDCKIYMCKTPGVYRVRVCRGRYQTGEPTVCSNELTFKVIDNTTDLHR